MISIFRQAMQYLFISIISTHFFIVSNADDSIDALLRDADNTLKPSSSSSSSKKKTPKTQQPKKNETSTEETRKEKKQEELSEPTLSEIPDEKLNKILSIDKNAEERSQSFLSTYYEVGLNFIQAKIGSGYSLKKEEDSFRLISGETFSGFMATYAGFYPVNHASYSWQHFYLIGAGFLSGEVQTELTGIKNSTEKYQENLVPILVGYGVSFPVYMFDVGLKAGVSTEFLNQKGMGYYDSASGFFYGDFLEAHMRWRITSEWALSLGYSKKDVFSLFPYNRSSGSSMRIGAAWLIGVSDRKGN